MIKIFQINPDRDEKRRAFTGYLKSNPVDASIYDMVFECDDVYSNLEDIFRDYNTAKIEKIHKEYPEIRIHSLSVSDIVYVEGSENLKDGYYFCDNIGWASVPEFDEIKTVRQETKENKIEVIVCRPGLKATVGYFKY